ncbi:YceI family protein [Telmatospirillum siberiense]|uniref:Polyisoprenoid-binding protein n=1 Tax=Telmatospirillum siberiense TaxID=382514 RepID=A0A2N3PUV5_9PROT|nr:YceI family protein [Telmatospirillum siberiense]PKU24189.1 polyisoprenoid-binding protein [Telmatospirillum siberiense]
MTFIRMTAVALACLLAAAPSAMAATWTVDTAKSSLGFAGSQSGTPFEGHFGKWQAQIDFDPANPASGHAVVTIDMGSAVTGDPQKDQSLPQSDWFNVKSFPQATFEATSFRARGGNAYEAVGSLSIRGIKKDVVLPFTFETEGSSGHAKGRLELLRTDYGVGQGEWSSGQMVGLSVAVIVDLRASK